MSTIGPVDLAAERAALGPNALEDVARRVIESGRYVLGPEVEALERLTRRMALGAVECHLS